MPRIRIVVEDDNGSPLSQNQQVYPLENNCDTLNQIEAAVETFRKKALPEVEHLLITHAQERTIEQEQKKTN